jgi:hypothetical protein
LFEEEFLPLLLCYFLAIYLSPLLLVRSLLRGIHVYVGIYLLAAVLLFEHEVYLGFVGDRSDPFVSSPSLSIFSTPNPT